MAQRSQVQRKSALPWRDWEVHGPGKSSVCPGVPASLWAPAVCGSFLEARGDCVACACALCMQESSCLECPSVSVGIWDTREVCKTEYIRMSIFSCGSLRAYVLCVAVSEHDPISACGGMYLWNWCVSLWLCICEMIVSMNHVMGNGCFQVFASGFLPLRGSVAACVWVSCVL